MGKDGTLKKIMKASMQSILDAEMSQHLGYENHSSSGISHGNSRNGNFPKKVLSDSGPIELEIPRDRNGEFSPQIVKKGQSRLGGLEDKIISMYAKGMTTRDIQAHIQDINGATISPTLVSHITDKIQDLSF